MANDFVPRRLGARALVESWLPVAIWMGVIFWLSSQSDLPHSPDPLIEVVTKKGAHAAEFAVLAALLLRAVDRHVLRPCRQRYVVLVWLIVLLYAASDEFHQSFTAGRSPSPLDVLIDTVGGTLGILMIRRWGPSFSHFFRLESRG